jgi:hypothetical protein
VFAIDQRLRGLPASREQVTAVYHSVNTPHLAIPGKPAGPAQAFIVGFRGAAGVAMFVYLYLAESQDCAVYVPERRSRDEDTKADQTADALGFVESMGFIMDDLNFAALPREEQDRHLRTLPVFLADPRLAATSQPSNTRQPKTPQDKLGRLFSWF